MGKGKKNAETARYIPRAPQTTLNFIENGDKKFEEVTCDLMAEEPGIEDAHFYGRQRQVQYGIDVWADRADGSGIEVASCKCYQSVRKGEIAGWSNDFLDHWDTHWKALRVHRFVLSVACDLNSHERRDEIEREKARFKRIGVKYEVWAVSKLTRMLRKHTDIRDVYFRFQFDASAGAGVAAQVAPPGTQNSGILNAAMIRQLADMQKLLSQTVTGRLDDLRAALQTGRLEGIETTLAGIVADQAGWASLDTALQARVLRMRAMLLMQTEKMAEALPLIEQAEALAPDEERRTRAVWVARTEGAAAAVPILGVPKTQDGALLRVGLLIETGKLPEATDALTNDPLITAYDAEWHRLSACTALYSGDRPGALQHSEQAEALAPENVAVLETGAVLRYALALSPAANFHFSDGPDASLVDFALQDEVSQAHVRKALELFDRLPQRAVTTAQKHRIGMWRVACLALVPERAKELKAECARLIAGTPPSGIAVVWALARGVDFDQEAAEKALRAELTRDPPVMEALQALIMMRLIRGEKDEALELLRQYGPRFKDTAAQRQVDAIRRRITRRRGKSAATEDAGPFDELLALTKPKWTGQQARAVDEYLADRKPAANVMLVGCLILASHNEWKHIVPHVQRLVGEVGNAEAIRLATYARYNTRDYAGVLALLENAADKFPAGKLPQDLLRIQALSAGHQGRIAQALPLAHQLAGQTGRPGDRMLYSELAVRSGNIAEALPFIRELHESDAVPQERLLPFIPSVATVDPALARSLLSKIGSSEIALEAGGTLLDWHYRLGMEKEAHALLQRLIALQPQDKRRPLRSAPLSEIAKFARQRQELHAELGARLRQDGAPIHVVAGALNANLVEVWERAFKDRDTALLIRSGNRSSISKLDVVPRTLALDITAVLTLEQLGLVETLLESPLELELPASLMELINALEQRLPHHQPVRVDRLQEVADAASSGKLKVWNATTTLLAKTLKVVFELPTEQKAASGGASPGGKSQDGRKGFRSQGRGEQGKRGSAAAAAGRANARSDPRSSGGSGATAGSEAGGSAADTSTTDSGGSQAGTTTDPTAGIPIITLSDLGEELVRSGRLPAEEFARIRSELAGWQGTSRSGAASSEPVSAEGDSTESAGPPEAVADATASATPESGAAAGSGSSPADPAGRTDASEIGSPATTASEIGGSQALLFQANTIESLFTANVVDRATQRWQLWIEEEHLQQVQAELRASREAEALAERIKQLRERLAKAIRDDRIRLLPVRFDESGKEVDAPHALMKPLSELLTLPANPDRWIWIDDRYATGYGSSNQNPIMSTYEVLVLLEQINVIDTAKHYELRMRLRRANPQVLPIDLNELMFWLTRVPERDGALVETEGLEALRRSFNTFASLVKDLRTQPGPYDQDRILELPSIVEAFSLLRDGLDDVWTRDEDSIEVRLARSDWLWHSLRLELPLQSNAEQRTRSLDLWRRTLSMLVMLGTTLTWQDEDGGARKAYFDWLTSRVPGLEDGTDPALMTQVVCDLRHVFRYDLEEGAEKLVEQGIDPPKVKALLSRVVLGLPSAIQDALYADASLMNSLGIRLRQVITMNGLEIEPVSFFATLARAAAGETVTVKTETGQEFTAEISLPRLTLKGPSTVALAGPEFELLSPDVAHRLTFLRSLAGGLDWHEPEDTAAIEALASTPVAWDRIRTWIERREATQIGRFNRLMGTLRAQKQVTVDEMLPANPSDYQAYLSLVFKDSQIDWPASGAAAIDRFGFTEALTRWAGLPIRLPGPFFQAYSALQPEQRSPLHARALAATATVSFTARVLELSVHASDDEAQVQKDILRHLLTNWTELAAGQLTVLEWSARVFKRRPEWRGASAALRLVSTWVHAERLVGMLLEGGVPRAQLSGFDSLTADGITEAMILEPQIEEDVSAPRRLTNRILLAYLLSAIVAGAKVSDPLASHREEILSRLMIEGPQGKYPAADLFQDRGLARDALGGGYLGQELDSKLAAELAFQGLQFGTSAGRDVMREHTLLYLNQQPLDLISWAQLHSVGQEWLPAAARRRIETTLERVQPSKSDPESPRRLLMGLSKVVPFLGDTARAKLSENAFQWTFALAQRHGALSISEDDSSDIHQDATAVTEFVFGLARRPDRVGFSQVLSELVPTCVRLWPALGSFWRGLIELAIQEGTTEENQALWAAHVATQRAP